LNLGAHTLELYMYDGEYDGRSFVLRDENLTQQLYQLDRTRPLTDVTRGPGGLTGRTILRRDVLPDGGVDTATTVSFWCGAAPD
jgi:hypothetical protein